MSDGTVARYKLVIGGGVISTLGFLGIATATLPVHAYVAGAAMVAFGVLPGLLTVTTPSANALATDWVEAP